ncbi:MAG: pentapeptide repeat-containing protein [Gaiellaceae bacterium]
MIVLTTARFEDAAVVTIPNATTSVSATTPACQRKRCNRVPPCCAMPARSRCGRRRNARSASGGFRAGGRILRDGYCSETILLGSGRGQHTHLVEPLPALRVGSVGTLKPLVFAGVRRASLSIVLLAAAVAISGVAVAATQSAVRSTCKILPKHGWTSCPRGNLAGRDLVRADLRNANLAGANLIGAKLTQADLATANLARAKLTRAHLDNANLAFASLVGAASTNANLSRATLNGANLAHANLSRANLGRANLIGANLVGANLAGANLALANLAGANLGGANLRGANLNTAALVGTNFSHANLTRAVLANATLSGSYLIGANLSGADLRGATLLGADLSTASLAGAKLGNVGWYGAICPNGRKTKTRC